MKFSSCASNIDRAPNDANLHVRLFPLQGNLQIRQTIVPPAGTYQQAHFLTFRHADHEFIVGQIKVNEAEVVELLIAERLHYELTGTSVAIVHEIQPQGSLFSLPEVVSQVSETYPLGHLPPSLSLERNVGLVKRVLGVGHIFQ